MKERNFQRQKKAKEKELGIGKENRNQKVEESHLGLILRGHSSIQRLGKATIGIKEPRNVRNVKGTWKGKKGTGKCTSSMDLSYMGEGEGELSFDGLEGLGGELESVPEDPWPAEWFESTWADKTQLQQHYSRTLCSLGCRQPQSKILGTKVDGQKVQKITYLCGLGHLAFRKIRLCLRQHLRRFHRLHKVHPALWLIVPLEPQCLKLEHHLNLTRGSRESTSSTARLTTGTVTTLLQMNTSLESSVQNPGQCPGYLWTLVLRCTFVHLGSDIVTFLFVATLMKWGTWVPFGQPMANR